MILSCCHCHHIPDLHPTTQYTLHARSQFVVLSLGVRLQTRLQLNSPLSPAVPVQWPDIRKQPTYLGLDCVREIPVFVPFINKKTKHSLIYLNCILICQVRIRNTLIIGLQLLHVRKEISNSKEIRKMESLLRNVLFNLEGYD